MSQTSSNTFAVSVRSNIPAAVPAWVPAPGKFANLGTSTLKSVTPAGWPTDDAGGPFELWSGGIYASDFSSLGAYVVHGAGHQNPGRELFSGVWAYDLDDLTWKGRNVPKPTLIEPVPGDGTYNSFGESNLPANAGHTYPSHTYDGLVYQAASNGGGAKGSLIRVGLAAWNRAVHRFDLLSPTNPPTRVLADSDVANGYAQSCVDSTRNCMWTLSGSGAGPLNKITFPNFTKTGFGTGFSSYGDNSLIYLPPPYDCLVSMGKSGDGNIGQYLGVWVSRIVSNIPQPWVFVPSVSGTPKGPGTLNTPVDGPNDPRCGGVWSTILNCIVSYQAAGSYKVHKLIPPANPANVTTDPWQWQSETLTGVSGATPSNHGHTPQGAWSRFIEVPKARCFIWCDSINQVPQAWRLAGM
jgi:hypothetical protein